MPIIQVRSTSEEFALKAPFPPTPKATDVIDAWKRFSVPCEIVVYPAGYVGNITPQGWRKAFNFLLCVDGSGERAELAMMGKISGQETPAELIDGVRNASPEVASDEIGSIAMISADAEETQYIASVLDSRTIAIGGLLWHSTESQLEALSTQLLPAAPVVRDPGLV